jgi:hypothetical protein
VQVRWRDCSKGGQRRAGRPAAARGAGRPPAVAAQRQACGGAAGGRPNTYRPIQKSLFPLLLHLPVVSLEAVIDGEQMGTAVWRAVTLLWRGDVSVGRLISGPSVPQRLSIGEHGTTSVRCRVAQAQQRGLAPGSDETKHETKDQDETKDETKAKTKPKTKPKTKSKVHALPSAGAAAGAGAAEPVDAGAAAGGGAAALRLPPRRREQARGRRRRRRRKREAARRRQAPGRWAPAGVPPRACGSTFPAPGAAAAMPLEPSCGSPKQLTCCLMCVRGRAAARGQAAAREWL